MNKNQLINFITFSILESKRVEDRLFRNEIHCYLTQLNKRHLKAITSEFILLKNYEKAINFYYPFNFFL